MTPKPWKIVSSQKNLAFRIFELRTDRAVSPRTGEAHDFYVLESRDWVNVIPVTPQNEVVLVRQYRHGSRSITLEIPGGIIEGTDSPESAARRELREETGFEAGEIIPLGWVQPNPAFLTNRCYTFIARDVRRTAAQQQDEKEDIQVLLEPLSEIKRLIREGSIAHSLVIGAFYRYFLEYPPTGP